MIVMIFVTQNNFQNCPGFSDGLLGFYRPPDTVQDFPTVSLDFTGLQTAVIQDFFYFIFFAADPPQSDQMINRMIVVASQEEEEPVVIKASTENPPHRCNTFGLEKSYRVLG